MAATTMIRRKDEMHRSPLEKCHDGVGALDWLEVLSPAVQAGKGLRFLHDDVLPPGVSIGVHEHMDDEEYYYIVAGSGVMTLNDEEHEVTAGDITGVFPGGRHGLENTSESDLRVIVISVACGRET
jgi:oxalate decarboxylase/phosphoglucose isomerase-like protein (cupin superfamily)